MYILACMFLSGCAFISILPETTYNVYRGVELHKYQKIASGIKTPPFKDNSTEKEVQNRINSQWLEDKKLLQSNYIINNLKKRDTESQIIKIHNILTK